MERRRLPEELVEMPPGPELAAVLAAVDPATLNGHDLVVLAALHSRMVSHYQAGLASVLEQVAHTPAGDGDAAAERVDEPSRWAPVEVAAALRWSVRRATVELHYAGQLVRRLPNVHAAWMTGRVDQARARAFVDGLVGLDDLPARAEADGLLAAGAGEWNLSRLAGQLRRRVIAADPPAADRRYAQRLTERRLLTRRHPEGTADLYGMHLPPHRVAEISERVTAIARTARRQGDPRSIDQLKADVFADLLAGTGVGATPPAPLTHQGPLPQAGPADQGTDAGKPAVVPLPGPRRGVLELTAPLSMLIGLSRAPGMVAGYGPVVADVVRQIVAQDPSLRWRYSIYDDLDADGQLAHHGIIHARPAVTGASPAGPHPARPHPARRISAGPTSAGRNSGGPGSEGLAGSSLAVQATPSARASRASRASRRSPAGPASARPGSARPEAVGPGSARPEAVGPGSARPEAVGPGSARPEAVRPGSARSSPTPDGDRDGFSAADAAFLRARDRTCRGPQGCTAPASACELDHTIAKVDGGGHERSNGGPLCSREHHFKHDSGARLRQPQPGMFEWITPLGHRYTVKTEPYDEATGPPDDSPPDDSPPDDRFEPPGKSGA